MGEVTEGWDSPTTGRAFGRVAEQTTCPPPTETTFHTLLLSCVANKQCQRTVITLYINVLIRYSGTDL